MKVYCPGCGVTADIGAMSRYACVQCSKCNRKYKGFEADLNRKNYYFNVLFNIFADNSYSLQESDRTCCYHCNGWIYMTPQKHGWHAPGSCKHCGNDLENEPAEQSEDEPVDVVLP